MSALNLTPPGSEFVVSPREHAAVLIEVCNGDLEAAWVNALSNRLSDAPLKDYWQSVADAIAERKP
jgi:hypothetical protein